MSFLETLQTQSKEDATKVLFDMLNAKAIDALSSMQEEQIDEADDKEHKPGSYSDKNPKIDLHNKHNKEYITSTNWSPNVKHAVKAYELKNPDMKGHVRGFINKGKNESVDESVEYFQIDELSKGTLGSYVKKATQQLTSRSYENGALDNASRKTKDTQADSDENSKVIKKRFLNIPKAVDKLTKEATDSLDEGVRKVDSYSNGRHKATTHKDSDLGEYCVKFHTDGKHLPDADYFTSDKEDAAGTAKHQVDQLHAKD